MKKGLTSSFYLVVASFAFSGMLVRGASAAMMMPQINQMEVQCTKKEMTVQLQFDTPFDGIVFSKGHYSDPACRYVQLGSNQSVYALVLPVQGCGTINKEGFFSNILVFQSDPVVQEIWDTSRRVTCRPEEKMTKLVAWNPLTVETLAVDKDKGDFECWMDIFKGIYPNTKPIDGSLKLGEEVSLVIYLKDPSGEYDVAIRDCWAYDGTKVEDETTLRVQLTTTDGCVKKPKLMHFWRRTTEVGDSTATLVSYSNVTAFRFPSEGGQLYFTCNVDVCFGSCDQRQCVGEESQINVVTKPGVLPFTTARPTTPIAIVVQTTTPAAVAETTTSTPVTPPQTALPTTTDCSPGSDNPLCPSTRPPIVIPNCIKNPQDPRCPQMFTSTSTSTTTTSPRPSTKPSVIVTTAPPPSTTLSPPFVVTSVVCLPGTNVIQCTTITKPIAIVTIPQTTPFRPTTTTVSPVVCVPGVTRDSRCPSSPTSSLSVLSTTEASTTFAPFSSSPKPPSVVTPIVCLPGTKDMRCPTTTSRPTVVTVPQTTHTQPPTITTPLPLVCIPGVTKDPRCPSSTTVAPLSTTASANPPIFTPIVCLPGSKDIRCPTTTTSRPETTTLPMCPSGTNDPNCSPVTTLATQTIPIRTTPKPPLRPTEATQTSTTQPTRPPCFPGTPVCPTSATSQPLLPPVCLPGSRDPRCPVTSPSVINPSSTTIQTTPPTRPTSTSNPFNTSTVMPAKPGWEGADPKYHAFHSWLYKPAPRPRGNKVKTSGRTE